MIKMKVYFRSLTPLCDTECTTAGFTNTFWWHWISVNSGEVTLWKHSHPVIRLGPDKEPSASTKGEIFLLFKERGSISAVTCWSFSSLPPAFSFLPLLSFVWAVDSRLGLKLKTFSVCLLVVSTRLFPSFPGTASLTPFWKLHLVGAGVGARLQE